MIILILDVGGPVVAERLSEHQQGKKAGSEKVGQKIRRKLADSLQPLVAEGDVLLEDPLNTGEILEKHNSVTLINHSPCPLQWEPFDKWHIPPGEIAAVLNLPDIRDLIAKFASKRSGYTGRRTDHKAKQLFSMPV